MEESLLHGRGPGGRPSYADELVEVLRVVVVAGLAVGIVVIGVGSRLFMLLLRLTSPDRVIGVTSDDGFEIGRLTLSGTYNLVVVGAAVGCIGAAAYVTVAPFLVGRSWFRWSTVGLTAMALAGSLLLHSDGVDFTLTGPLWFAVTLFVLLPLVSGVALAAVTDAVARPGSWTVRGRTRWLLPPLLFVLVPTVLPVVAALVPVVALVVLLRRLVLDRVRRSPLALLGARSAFFVIPALSFLALGQDLAELF